MEFAGFYINLDRSSARREALSEHLQELAILNHYQRFAGLEPTEEEREDLRGLKTPGELGIWKSLLAVTSMIAQRKDLPAFVHIIEDDARFNRDMPRVLNDLTRQLAEAADSRIPDLIFLDYFLTRQLFGSIAAELTSADQRGNTHHYRLVNGSAYLACCSSMLLRRASAEYIHETLARMLQNQSRLAPVDITLRTLIRAGVLRAALLWPPLGACEWDASQASTIQSQSSDGLNRSRSAHILLRLCAARLQSPQWCAERLAELFPEAPRLPDSAEPTDFGKIFSSIEGQLVQF
jgi:GR25 family glycosyltransferase involved in LPS biosynthesis